MKPVKVVVVGQGLIGRQRAAAAATLDGVEVVATVDPAAPQVSSIGPGVPHHTQLSDVALDYDAAIVAVPHDVASAIGSEALSAGKAILLEKPLGTTPSEARMLEQLAADRSRPSFVGFNYRFLPSVAALIDVVVSGRLGRLRSIDLLIGHGGNRRSAEGWKLDPERAGGGVLRDPGVHLLDLLLLLLPAATPAAVEATRGFWRTGIEEDVAALFRADHVIASLRVSHIRWINTFRLEVFGEDGYAIAEGRGGNYGPMRLRVGERWAWERAEGKTQRETEEIRDFGDRDSSLIDELRAVVASWRGEPLSDRPVHPATMIEARNVTELCDDLYRALG